MGRRDNIFKLFPIEYVDSNKVAFSMTVLTSLWGRNLHHLQHNIIFNHILLSFFLNRLSTIFNKWIKIVTKKMLLKTRDNLMIALLISLKSTRNSIIKREHKKEMGFAITYENALTL